MTKVGKTLIAVLVAADLAFVFYIMSPQSDHSSGKSDVPADASVKMPALDSGANNATQVAAGAIANALPASAAVPSAASGDWGVAAAPPPRPVAVPNVLLGSHLPAASAPAIAPSAPAAAPAVPVIAANVPKEAPSVAVRQQPVKTVDVTNTRKPVDTKVRQSARIEQASNDAQSNDAHSAGANPVAAAMTEALVRQSAQLDPSLPPPDMSKTVSLHDSSDSSSRGGANPVAAAMTEQLVRQSTRFNPPVHTPSQSGAQ
jgi:hypothetical protein